MSHPSKPRPGFGLGHKKVVRTFIDNFFHFWIYLFIIVGGPPIDQEFKAARKEGEGTILIDEAENLFKKIDDGKMKEDSDHFISDDSINILFFINYSFFY